MSDMLSSVIGSVFGGFQDSPAIPQKTNAASEQTFSDLLNHATKKQTTLSASASLAKPETAAEQFMKYQKMTMAEKFRASYLAEKGLTEEDLKAMSPEERLKIENEIAEKIRQKIAESSGHAVKDPNTADAA